MKITFSVPGDCKSMQTGSVVRTKDGRAFPIRRNTAYAERVYYQACQVAPEKPIEGPVAVTIIIDRTRPKSLPKKIEHPIQHPDIDNNLKGLLDAMNGVIYKSDSQVVSLYAIKRFGYPPGVQILIETVEEGK